MQARGSRRWSVQGLLEFGNFSCPQIPKQGAVGTTTKPSARREKASCRRMGRDLQVPTVDVAVTNLLASCCGFEGVTVEGYIAT